MISVNKYSILLLTETGELSNRNYFDYLMSIVSFFCRRRTSRMSSDTSFLSQHNLNSYYLDEDSSDVSFDCGNDEVGREIIPAHKFTLGISSDYFNCMFRGKLAEIENPIRFPDASPDGVRTVLRYFYFHHYDMYMLNMDVIEEAIYLARKWLIDGYLDACCHFLEQQDSAEGILNAFELSIKHELHGVKRSTSFKIFTSTENIFESEHFLSIDSQLLEDIMKSEDALISQRLLTAILKWAEKECEKLDIAPDMQNCRQMIAHVMKYFDFGVLRQLELLECIQLFNEFFTKEEIVQITAIIATRWPHSVPFDGAASMEDSESSDAITTLKSMAQGTSHELRFMPHMTVILSEIEVGNLFVEGGRRTKSILLKIKLVKVRDLDTNEATPKEVDILTLFLDFKENTTKGSGVQKGVRSMRVKCTESIILKPDSVYALRTIAYDKCWYLGRELSDIDQRYLKICERSSSNWIHALR